MERRPRIGWILTLIAACSLGTARAALGGGAQDSVRSLVVEVGGSVEGSNEVFVTESFEDTTFAPPSRQAFTQTSPAALASVRWRSAAGGASHWAARGEAAWGADIQRFSAVGAWARSPVVGWEWWVEPRVEYRDDSGFDLGRRDIRGALELRARRRLDDGLHSLRSRLSGERYRGVGNSRATLLDRDQLQAEAGIWRDPWWGMGGHLALGGYGRTFPDSSTRDHVEGYGELELESGPLAAVPWRARAAASRRVPTRDAASTRDDLGRAEFDAEARAPLDAAVDTRLQFSEEATRYLRPDSLLFFDYTIARVQASLGPHPGAVASWRLGPEWERLDSPTVAEEQYQEVGLFLDGEILTPSSWGTLRPVVRRRRYSVPPTSATLHSSFKAFDLQASFDQSLPGALRLRWTGFWSHEWHDRSTDDTTSLYFLVDVRRVF